MIINCMKDVKYCNKENKKCLVCGENNSKYLLSIHGTCYTRCITNAKKEGEQNEINKQYDKQNEFDNIRNYFCPKKHRPCSWQVVCQTCKKENDELYFKTVAENHRIKATVKLLQGDGINTIYIKKQNKTEKSYYFGRELESSNNSQSDKQLVKKTNERILEIFKSQYGIKNREVYTEKEVLMLMRKAMSEIHKRYNY